MDSLKKNDRWKRQPTNSHNEKSSSYGNARGERSTYSAGGGRFRRQDRSDGRNRYTAVRNRYGGRGGRGGRGGGRYDRNNRYGGQRDHTQNYPKKEVWKFDESGFPPLSAQKPTIKPALPKKLGWKRAAEKGAQVTTVIQTKVSSKPNEMQSIKKVNTPSTYLSDDEEIVFSDDDIFPSKNGYIDI